MPFGRIELADGFVLGVQSHNRIADPILREPSRQSSPSFASQHTASRRPHVLVRFMAPPNPFKPAALPLMEAGKAMATAGEMWVDLISSTDFANSFFGSGGGGDNNNINNNNNKALYACGVQLRNAGDALAQAAATGRFAYGMEMTSNELRESASCFQSATNLLQQAVTARNTASQQDNLLNNPSSDEFVQWNQIMGTLRLIVRYYVAFLFRICRHISLIRHSQSSDRTCTAGRPQHCHCFTERTISHFTTCSVTLEAAGAGIMQRRPFPDIGTTFLECAQALQDLAQIWSAPADGDNDVATTLSSRSNWSPTLTASASSLGRQFALVATGVAQGGSNLQPASANAKSSSSTRPW